MHSNFIETLLDNFNKDKFIIKKFTEFDNKTIANVRLYLKKNKLPHKTKQQVIKSALNEYYGWIYHNTLYYRDNLELNDIISTVLHEYVHWLRKQEKTFKYKTSNDIFIEEFFAELVSEYYINNINKKNYIITPEIISSTIKIIISKYNLDICKNKAHELVYNNIDSIAHYFH
jgi:uncharacterized protein YjaZ